MTKTVRVMAVTAQMGRLGRIVGRVVAVVVQVAVAKIHAAQMGNAPMALSALMGLAFQ